MLLVTSASSTPASIVATYNTLRQCPELIKADLQSTLPSPHPLAPGPLPSILHQSPWVSEVSSCIGTRRTLQSPCCAWAAYSLSARPPILETPLEKTSSFQHVGKYIQLYTHIHKHTPFHAATLMHRHTEAGVHMHTGTHILVYTHLSLLCITELFFMVPLTSRECPGFREVAWKHTAQEHTGSP